MSQPVPSAFVLRELMRGAADETLRRPLWEFPPEERRAVIAERAVRWGAPDAENDFDPEYH
jgi:hypothetical protein